jgi:hypothetical protein
MGAMDANEILTRDRDEWKKRALAAESKLKIAEGAAVDLVEVANKSLATLKLIVNAVEPYR